MDLQVNAKPRPQAMNLRPAIIEKKFDLKPNPLPLILKWVGPIETFKKNVYIHIYICPGSLKSNKENTNIPKNQPSRPPPSSQKQKNQTGREKCLKYVVECLLGPGYASTLLPLILPLTLKTL